MFNIEIMDGAGKKGTLLINEFTKKPYTWEAGDEAQREVVARNDKAKLDGLAIRYKVKRAEMPASDMDKDWRQRENMRFAKGTYKPVPWVSEAWFVGSKADKDHYLHVSVDKPGMIAYTPSANSGQMDRQEQMTAGRYLHKYFEKQLTPDLIRQWAGRVYATSAQFKLCFASTPEEIEMVYRIGPDTCMSKTDGAYKATALAGMLPAAVYGAGDLKIAYIAKGGKAHARSVCWPEKKVYGRVYPEDAGAAQQELRNLLDNMGWRHYPRETFGMYDGAKLLKVPVDGNHLGISKYNAAFLVPYLDHGRCVVPHEDGQHLKIADKPGLFARSQYGYAYGYLCGCGATTNPESGSTVGWLLVHPKDTIPPEEATSISCPKCAKDNKAHECRSCRRRFAVELTQAVGTTGDKVSVCKYCVRGWHKCAGCDLHAARVTTVFSGKRTNNYCVLCIEKRKKEGAVSYCGRCQLHRDTTVKLDDGRQCNDCLPVITTSLPGEEEDDPASATTFS